MRVFGPKRDEVTGDWRKLHNEEVHNFYFLTNIIRLIKSRRMRLAGSVARSTGEMRNAYKTLVGKRQLGRPRLRWKDHIKMYLGETW
jgi:hypothetical protein